MLSHHINFEVVADVVSKRTLSCQILLLQSIKCKLKTLVIKNYFLTPKDLFFNRILVPWHFLHLEEEIGFFPPHLKQILKNNLRC